MDKHYIFEVGKRGRSRLDLLGHFLNPLSRRFLGSLGLSEGMNILEAGCGTGTMTAWLAQSVGPNGRVIALDVSQEQLDLARNTIDHLGLDNVEFVCSPIEDAVLQTNFYDIVYSRFLFIHLREPKHGLDKLKTLVKVRGIVACEEPIVSNTQTYPETDIWDQAISLYQCLSNGLGIDSDYGLRIADDMQDIGLSIFSRSFSQAILTREETIEYLRSAFSEVKQVLLKSELMTEESYVNVMDSFGSGLYDSIRYSTFHKVAQIAARKLVEGSEQRNAQRR